MRPMRGWWRSVRNWWALAAVAGIAALLAAVGQVYTGAGAGAAIAAAAAVTAVVTDLLQNRLAGTGGRRPGAGPLVCRVDRIRDPLKLGVHAGAALAGEAGLQGRVTPYVPRDRMPDLAAALRGGGFVLVVGDSTAGKTRLAYETLRAELPRHILIDPGGADGLPQAVEAVQDHRPSVLWLDDLERYLGVGGLTPRLIEELLAGDKAPLLLATIRAHERSGLSARQEAGRQPGERQSLRLAREVLDLVSSEVRLERRWSAVELAAARASGDPRIRAAVDSADRYGVAEHIAAGPELVKELTDAWEAAGAIGAAAGGGPRGAALVTAAVDARLAGYHRPLPVDLLVRLHEGYLRERGINPQRLVDVAQALAWATQPVYGVSSLLEPVGDEGMLAFDYLVDVAAQDGDRPPVPREVWVALLEHADPNDAVAVLWEATYYGHADLGLGAFDRAMAARRHQAAAEIAICLGEVGVEQAADLLERAIAEAEAAGGADARDLLDYRASLAWLIGGRFDGAGDPARALPLARDIAQRSRELYGADDEQTIRTEITLIRQVGAAGDHGEALRMAVDAVARSSAAHGPAHPLTLSARFEEAVWRPRVDGPAEGVRCWSELLEFAEAEQAETGWSFVVYGLGNMGEWQIKAGDTAAGLDSMRRAVEAAYTGYGPGHFHVLMTEYGYAYALHNAGEREQGYELMSRLADEAGQLLGEAHQLTTDAREALGSWSASG